MGPTFTTIANGCAYFRRRSDGTCWAVQLGMGKQPIAAVGPLLQSEQHDPPFKHDFRIAPEGAAIAAFDWRLGSDYEQLGGVWRRNAAMRSTRDPQSLEQRRYLRLA